jgi:hypothetical protein
MINKMIALASIKRPIAKKMDGFNPGTVFSAKEAS